MDVDTEETLSPSAKCSETNNGIHDVNNKKENKSNDDNIEQNELNVTNQPKETEQNTDKNNEASSNTSEHLEDPKSKSDSNGQLADTAMDVDASPDKESPKENSSTAPSDKLDCVNDNVHPDKASVSSEQTVSEKALNTNSSKVDSSDKEAKDSEIPKSERLRNWEARERRRAKEYEKEKCKAEEQKKDEAKEARRLKEFLEDYDDEKDDPKYFKGSYLVRRMKEREKEIEEDMLDRQREKEELDELRKKLVEEGHPDPEAEVERDLSVTTLVIPTTAVETSASETSEIHTPSLPKYVDVNRELERRARIREPSPQPIFGKPVKESRLMEPPRPETTESDPEPSPVKKRPIASSPPDDKRQPTLEEEISQNSFSGFSDVVTQQEEVKLMGFTSLRLEASPDGIETIDQQELIFTRRMVAKIERDSFEWPSGPQNPKNWAQKKSFNPFIDPIVVVEVLTSPFAAAPGLGSPLIAAGAGALPLGSFELSPAATTEAALGALRFPDQPLSTVLLVSNLNEEHSKRKSTTTAPVDTSSREVVNTEIAKEIKERFRTKVSSYVVQFLNPYRKDDCRVAKITSNEDFKYLARKLTYIVMAKELKHCKHVEDLDANDSVKFKAREFIHNFMASFGVKYGPIYYRKKKM